MSEIITIPEGSELRARSLIGGSFRPGVIVPPGDYEIGRNPAGAYRYIYPAGQDPYSHVGTYYYPDPESFVWKPLFAKLAAD